MEEVDLLDAVDEVLAEVELSLLLETLDAALDLALLVADPLLALALPLVVLALLALPLEAVFEAESLPLSEALVELLLLALLLPALLLKLLLEDDEPKFRTWSLVYTLNKLSPPQIALSDPEHGMLQSAVATSLIDGVFLTQ